MGNIVQAVLENGLMILYVLHNTHCKGCLLTRRSNQNQQNHVPCKNLSVGDSVQETNADGGMLKTLCVPMCQHTTQQCPTENATMW